MTNPSDDSSIAAFEKAVKKEFGKEFDASASSKRAPAILAFWEKYVVNGKTFLDVGAGHPVVPAIISGRYPEAMFDCVDVSPDFEEGASRAVRDLGGDPARFRFVTADFYDIGGLSKKGRLRDRYDFILLTETLHHSLRKAHLLKILTDVMDADSRMILVEPVLPAIGTKAAYDQSRWARNLGYIEEPVTMKEYRRAFSSAGLLLEKIIVETSREHGLKSWKRNLAPESLYRFYRRHLRPIFALTTFIFECRLASPGGSEQSG